jgi:hypothetical protein
VSSEEKLILSRMRDDLDVRNRSVGLFRTIYKDCMIAREIVNWFLDRKICSNEMDALRLGNRLVTTKQIEPVTNVKEPFKKNQQLYRFVETNK